MTAFPSSAIWYEMPELVWDHTSLHVFCRKRVPCSMISEGFRPVEDLYFNLGQKFYFLKYMAHLHALDEFTGVH